MMCKNNKKNSNFVSNSVRGLKYAKNKWNFSYVGGGGESGGVIFLIFSATHQNASNAFLSNFRHFYFFLCVVIFLKHKEIIGSCFLVPCIIQYV